MIVALFAWMFYRDYNRPRSDDVVAYSDFGAQYGRTWELLEQFSRCGKGENGARPDDVVAAQAAYAAMRDEVASSAFAIQARIIDRQFQLFSQPRSDQTIRATDVCVRTAYLAPVSASQMMAANEATGRFVAK